MAIVAGPRGLRLAFVLATPANLCRMLALTRYYYSTQAFLAWCVGHYFAGGRHYSWVGSPFHPYKRPNPASSNPYLIYASLYQPWYDRDPYDRTIRSLRDDLKRASQSLALPAATRRRLRRCCHRIDLEFFLPVVYRVDVKSISPWRLEQN